MEICEGFPGWEALLDRRGVAGRWVDGFIRGRGAAITWSRAGLSQSVVSLSDRTLSVAGKQRRFTVDSDIGALRTSLVLVGEDLFKGRSLAGERRGGWTRGVCRLSGARWGGTRDELGKGRKGRQGVLSEQRATHPPLIKAIGVPFAREPQRF